MRSGMGILLAVVTTVIFGFAGCGTPQPGSGQDAAGSGVAVGSADLGGVVTSTKGPEAGVWVIAETTDLPTKFTKIVVTDDQGGYLIPELPKAGYNVWVRGYGLVDSPKVRTGPGRLLNLTAAIAPNVAEAAKYFPPIYWYSLLKIPDKSEFPGKGPAPKGNDIAEGMRTQGHWLNQIRSNGCGRCHAMGSEGTRTIPKELGQFQTSFDAWARRIVSGQALTQMTQNIANMGPRALTQFADWTDRIGAGELPFARPTRPQGVERNVVLTMWDYGTNTMYVHDVIATDRRNPAVNANGKLYGATEASTDNFPVIDPLRNASSEVRHPVRDPKTPSANTLPMAPSPYWGDKPIWDSQANLHNPMMDGKGRVWFTASIRPAANPDYCKKGSDHPSARVFPIESSNRQASMYDPATGKITLISTCFTTHHLNFAEDADNTLWFNYSAMGMLGWLNTRMYEQTGDEVKSQGWAPFILDANGNGKRDAWVEPNQPLDPNKDKRFGFGMYNVSYNPVDGTLWGPTSADGAYPGYLVRLNPGPNPAETGLAEVYQVPAPGFGPRGGDIDRNGVYWVSLSSGHLGSFDRSKCRAPLNGPKAATGQHCPEGWSLYPLPGPQFQGLNDPGSAESSYFTWVDQFGILGLGRNVPIATGNLNESILALVDGKFVNLRVPYPMGFNNRGMDGRIDDPKAGWKGRAVWTTYASRANFHSEGGTARKPQVVKFQMRPDPLAR
jgi:streptogramin lyase